MYQELNFSHNNISFIPDEITKCPALSFLNLENNALCEIFPALLSLATRSRLAIQFIFVKIVDSH